MCCINRIPFTNTQAGGAILSLVVLLTLLMSLTLVYTGRVKSVEYKIQRNSLNHLEAAIASQGGLNKVIAMLNEEPEWPGSTVQESLGDSGSFQVNLNHQTLTIGEEELAYLQLSSQGWSADGLATVTTSQQFLVFPFLQRTPYAPLTVVGGISNQFRFMLGANPNGGGPGVPVSVYSDTSVSLSAGNGVTCGLSEFHAEQCDKQPYSSSVNKGPDIVDDGASFPTDVGEWLTGIPIANYQSYMALAGYYASGCSGLTSDFVGIAYITGNCAIATNATIGSPDEPLLLILEDGDFSMVGGEFWGVVFMITSQNSHANADVFVSQGATIRGALIADFMLGSKQGELKISFEPGVFEVMREHKAFLRFTEIAGSWRDF